MITTEVLVTTISGLRRQDLDNWIFHQWVRPDVADGHYLFHEIDVARVRLIRELRDEMEVNEDALPVVLSLLDQIYDLRRRMHRLSAALDNVTPEEIRRELAEHLNRPGE